LLSQGTVSPLMENTKNPEYKGFDSCTKQQRLKKFDRNGKIYIPAFIRQLFRGYRFYVLVDGGKIVLDPIKIDDDVPKGFGGDSSEDY